MLLNLGPWNSESLAIPDGKILVLVPAINNRWVACIIAIGALAQSRALRSGTLWLLTHIASIACEDIC